MTDSVSALSKGTSSDSTVLPFSVSSGAFTPAPGLVLGGRSLYVFLLCRMGMIRMTLTGMTWAHWYTSCSKVPDWRSCGHLSLHVDEVLVFY